MIKLLTQSEQLILSLENVLASNQDDILKWMADFSQMLTTQSFEMKSRHNHAVLDTVVLKDMGKALSILNIPPQLDFKPFMQAFEKVGFRPFPVRSEYNLNDRNELGEFIIRSVLTLYDDAATHPNLSRTENGLILRDYLAYERMPTSIIKAYQSKTPAQRLNKSMARPHKYHS